MDRNFEIRYQLNEMEMANRIINLEDSNKELEAQNKTLRADLFKLQRSTTIDQGSFAGPDAKDDK